MVFVSVGQVGREDVRGLDGQRSRECEEGTTGAERSQLPNIAACRNVFPLRGGTCDLRRPTMCVDSILDLVAAGAQRTPEQPNPASPTRGTSRDRRLAGARQNKQKNIRKYENLCAKHQQKANVSRIGRRSRSHEGMTTQQATTPRDVDGDCLRCGLRSTHGYFQTREANGGRIED